MIEIREMCKEDIPFALELTASEQWTDSYSDWLALITYRPKAAFVAEEKVSIRSPIFPEPLMRCCV
ncbi:MAG: hypothetical protein BAJATHORv1_20061 [Candidatus Thorarchaeota archaeon]|nr:MAG: hypothetical protein BAJATHORv1_20061 [Candidatus Thorarchaeota archaeon]